MHNSFTYGIVIKFLHFRFLLKKFKISLNLKEKNCKVLTLKCIRKTQDYKKRLKYFMFVNFFMIFNLVIQKSFKPKHRITVIQVNTTY